MTDTKSAIHDRFPVFARHAGVWEGTYKLIDIKSGTILDQHRSKVTCKMFDQHNYYQTNEYHWEDGRTVTREFPGEFRDGALCFDTPRMIGKAYEVDENTICLFWTYKDKSEDRYAEIISLQSTTHRCRTWQHFENGNFTKVTVIDEHKTQ